MKLFRGDNIFNVQTEPDLFRFNGLMTKAFGSGVDSENLELTGILNSVKFHVRHNSKKKKAYYDVSDYLSFTESYERAKYWCSERNELPLNPAQDYDETRYIFELDINNSKLNKIEDGIYSYNYNCNFKLRKSDSGEIIHRSTIEYINSTQTCPRCQNKNLKHQLILINSLEFLESKDKTLISSREIKFAKQDQEWLLLPNDLDYKTNKRLTKIPRSDFWTVNLFKVKNEPRPIKGRI